MPYKSLVQPNLNAKESAGWCLGMQQKVWGCPVANPNATVAFDKTVHKNLNRELPNVPVPVWFSWWNASKKIDEGHVVAWIPGRGFLSSPGAGFGQQWFNSIAAVENYFRCKFRGWSLDINGKFVAEYAPDPAPAPVAKPVNTGQGGDYHTVVELAGYVNAADATNRQNSNSRVPAGDYKIFNTHNGVVNITRNVNEPGWWINPADNVQQVPPINNPSAPTLSVGDTVAPNATQTKSFEGVDVYAWHDRYTLIELNGERAVLAIGGAVWSSIRVSDIHKV